MAGAKLSGLGADIRKLIRDEQGKGGNPTWGTVGPEVLKFAKKHGDKRDEKKLGLVFQSHKVAIQKQDGKPASTTGKKRGRPKKEASIALFDAGEPVKKKASNGVSSHGNGNGHYSFDLAIKFAQEAGGLDAAIATLNKLKAIKESL